MQTDKRAPRCTTIIDSICSSCGLVKHLTLARWKAARKVDAWPECKKCRQRLYPVQRRCTDCQAVLRNGNLGKHCAPCERRRNIFSGIRFQIEMEKAAQ